VGNSDFDIKMVDALMAARAIITLDGKYLPYVAF
jgi:cyanate lyase